jgi:tubulin polyglutamylase TTLL6/13
VEGFKFDFRLYVLINGVAPMRIYMFEDGLARLATVKYEPPVKENLHRLKMHLTNYAINKNSTSFVYNTAGDKDDIGSKRSFKSILRLIHKQFGPAAVAKCLAEIKDLIIKTCCISQPHVFHLMRSAQPDDLQN